MKLKHFILALVAMLSGFAFTANAQEATGVATLEDLQAALAAEDNNPIVITETIVIPANETVTIDLNGKTVTRQDETVNYAINNLGTLTIQDTKGNGSINARGIYNGYGNGGANVATAKIIVKSGTFNAKGTNGGAAIFNYGVADIQGGNFTSVGSYSLSNQSGSTMTVAEGVTVNNGIYASGATLVVNGGEINGNRSGCHVVYAWNSTVTINGGTFYNNNSGNSTIMAAGTTQLTIVGGTFGIKDGRIPGDGNTWTSFLTDTQNSATMIVNGGTFNGGFRVQGGTTMTINGGSFNNCSGSGYNISGTAVVKGGTFTDAAAQTFAKGKLAEDCKLGEDGKVVSKTPTLPDYVVLPEGMNASNYESAFGTNTVTDGTNYYATLQAAVEAVAGQANAVLYCKPGAELGSMQHAPVVSTLTIYGNGASVTGFEHFDLGNTDKNDNSGLAITADMTLTIKNLNGFSVWGAKSTTHNVSVVIEDCDDMGKVFITGTTGTLNIAIAGSKFEGREKEAVYSNADGAIALTNVAFSNLNKAINLNHKAAGTQTVTIDGCSFTNCGNDVAADQIPVRVLSSIEGGKSVLTVSNTTFTGTPEGGADILLDYGVGESTMAISSTAANVTVETEKGVTGTTTAVTEEDEKSFSNVLSVAVAKIGEQSYATLTDAFAAVTSDDQTVVILSDVTENLVGSYLRGNITTENGAKVTITLTNSDWVYCLYTFVLGENITLNMPTSGFFYYAGGTQINGTVVAEAYYQRYAGTKLTINEPGSMTVTSEMFYLRYTNGDANAGIYINGDNNDKTVGLNASVIYFYQGMINAKNANIKAGTYWQTNDTDGQGSANLVLDNSTLTVTVYDHPAKATGNSTVTLTNGSVIDAKNGGFTYGDAATLSVDATSKIIDKGGVELPVTKFLSGTGTEADPYLIKNVDDLILFRNSVNAGETKYNAEGVYVALGANIDMAGVDWSVNIGDDCNVTFDGIFDGKNYTISNLTSTETAEKADGYICAGLFGAIYGKAVVKNFTLENVTINTSGFKGNNASAVVGFAYEATGSVENVKVTGNINAAKVSGVGAIVGYAYKSSMTITGCEVTGATITGAAYVGGIIGYSTVDVLNDNTVVNVKVDATSCVAGGVAGIMLNGGSASNNTVKEVTLTSEHANWQNAIGAVVGCITEKVTVENTTIEDVNTTALVGSEHKDKPTTPVAKVQARIGNTYYAALKTATSAAQASEVITLIADVEADYALNITSALDLNGHSLIATVAPTALPEGYAALPNLDGKFVVGAEPTATVNKLGAMTVAESDYIVYNGSKSGDMPLSFVMQFLANQDEEDMETSPFADWYGDFVLTFSGLSANFVADGCYLAGYYGDFGWVKVPVDGMIIENEVRYPVMLGVGLGQKYEYICSDVKDFRCALYLTPEILEANPNLTVTLELSVVDNSKGEEAATEALVNKNNIYEVVAEDYVAAEFNHVEFVDGKEFVNEADRTVASLTYKRTLPYANFWMPLYVPFNIPMSALIENYDVARFNGVNAAGTIELVKIEDSETVLEANTPLVIRAKSGEAKTMEITLNDVVLKANTVNEVTCGSYKIRGTYQRTTINDNERVLGMSAEGKAAWGKLAAGVSLNPQRLILTITDSSLNSIRMRVVGEDSDEDVTNIYDVEVDAEQGARIFDLQGRRVLEPQKGHLYIINGKKVVY